MAKLTKTKDADVKNAIACIKGGKNSGDIIFFDNTNKNEPILKVNNLFDYIDISELKKEKKYMTNRELIDIKKAFEHNEINSNIRDIYNNLKPKIDKKVKNHIHNDDGIFSVLPRIEDNQVQKIFISGMSGSGKSTYIADYAKNYQKIYPKNKIYIISRHDSDDVLDNNLKNIKRLQIDSELLDTDINLEDLENSLVIFDDTETIQDKHLKKFVFDLRCDMLQNCRHHNIFMACVEHQILNHASTRLLILECDMVVFFPRSGSYQIKNYLKNYQGYDKETINMIMSIKSRWITINKNTYPNTIISENDIYIL